MSAFVGFRNRPHTKGKKILVCVCVCVWKPTPLFFSFQGACLVTGEKMVDESRASGGKKDSDETQRRRQQANAPKLEESSTLPHTQTDTYGVWRHYRVQPTGRRHNDSVQCLCVCAVCVRPSRFWALCSSTLLLCLVFLWRRRRSTWLIRQVDYRSILKHLKKKIEKISVWLNTVANSSRYV